MQSGTTVGGFTAGAEIGSGGFGAVYRARGPQGEEVALKVSRTAASRLSAQELAWQENEIEALLQLDHPSLVKLYGHGLTGDGHIFIAVELATGVRLDHYLAQHGRLDVIEAIAIVRTIAEALAYCHGLDILHLDLKPQNIVLTDPHAPRLKVLDFGMAHLRGAMGALGAAPAGTLAYMALLMTDPARRLGSATVLVERLKSLFHAVLRGAERDAAPRSIGPQLTPPDVPFVGRTAETWELFRELSAAAEGLGRAVLLVGETGIGKSRLVLETVQRVAAARGGGGLRALPRARRDVAVCPAARGDRPARGRARPPGRESKGRDPDWHVPAAGGDRDGGSGRADRRGSHGVAGQTGTLPAP